MTATTHTALAPRVATTTTVAVATPGARHALAVLRLATGFIFLWAFLDKTFGLGFSTPAERAWINGGTPSQGFLLGDAVTGPLKGFFSAIASPASDLLFMLGMLGIGLAGVIGIGLRVSAVVGTLIMVLMYLRGQDYYWSVVVRGTAERLANDAEIEESGVLALTTATPPVKWNYIRITPTTISGRRFTSQKT